MFYIFDMRAKKNTNIKFYKTRAQRVKSAASIEGGCGGRVGGGSEYPTSQQLLSVWGSKIHSWGWTIFDSVSHLGWLSRTAVCLFVTFLFLGNFLSSCGCSTAKSKTPPQETIFLPTYRYSAWVPTILTTRDREHVSVPEVRIEPGDLNPRSLTPQICHSTNWRSIHAYEKLGQA